MRIDLNESLEKLYFRPLNESKGKLASWAPVQSEDEPDEFWIRYDLKDDHTGHGPFAIYFNLINSPSKPAKWEDFEFDYYLDDNGYDYELDIPVDSVEDAPNKIKKEFTDLYNM